MMWLVSEPLGDNLESTILHNGAAELILSGYLYELHRLLRNTKTIPVVDSLIAGSRTNREVLGSVQFNELYFRLVLNI